MMPNHSPSAIHSWRERRYPPSDPNEKVQKMREAQHGRRDPTLVPMPSAPIQDALDQLDEDGCKLARQPPRHLIPPSH
jgi:hypothetical protein